MFQTACDAILRHSQVQSQALSEVFAYLCDLNSLVMTLKLEKDRHQNEENEHNNSDAIAHIQQHLLSWLPEGPFWHFEEHLWPVVAQACPAGGQIARSVWLFFQQLQWRHPNLSRQKDDFGITWYELTIHYTLYAGKCLPIWVKHKDHHRALLYDFDSPEVAILKPEVRSLWHQAHNFRAVVKYLESSTGTKLYPRYKKTGASTMIRLGFHRSLVGGIPSRPKLPQVELALQILSEYASLPGQPYPLNVRVPYNPKLDNACITDFGPPDIPFADRNNLYQRVRKCLRNKQCLSTISLDT